MIYLKILLIVYTVLLLHLFFECDTMSLQLKEKDGELLRAKIILLKTQVMLKESLPEDEYRESLRLLDTVLGKGIGEGENCGR